MVGGREARSRVQLAVAVLFTISCALVIAGSLWALDWADPNDREPSEEGEGMHAPPGPGLLVLIGVPFLMVPFAAFGALLAAVLVWRTLSGVLLVEGDALKNAILGLAMFALPLLMFFDLSEAWVLLIVGASFIGWWIAAVAIARSAFSRRPVPAAGPR